MSTIIDMTKPGAREAVHMLQCYYGLKVESETGLRHSRGSVMNLAREKYNIQQRTKKGVMRELAKKLKADHGIDVEPKTEEEQRPNCPFCGTPNASEGHDCN